MPEKGSRHAALDMGCDTCHMTHKTGAEPTPENRFHLTKAAPALCLDCHDAKDADFKKRTRISPSPRPIASSATIRTSPPRPS